MSRKLWNVYHQISQLSPETSRFFAVCCSNYPPPSPPVFTCAWHYFWRVVWEIWSEHLRDHTVICCVKCSLDGKIHWQNQINICSNWKCNIEAAVASMKVPSGLIGKPAQLEMPAHKHRFILRIVTPVLTGQHITLWHYGPHIRM